MPVLLSLSALSYCDLFSLLWLHMSPSRVITSNSMNSAFSSPLPLNHSKLSSGYVHGQEEQDCWGPIELAEVYHGLNPPTPNVKEKRKLTFLCLKKKQKQFCFLHREFRARRLELVRDK